MYLDTSESEFVRDDLSNEVNDSVELFGPTRSEQLDRAHRLVLEYADQLHFAGQILPTNLAEYLAEFDPTFGQ